MGAISTHVLGEVTVRNIVEPVPAPELLKILEDSYRNPTTHTLWILDHHTLSGLSYSHLQRIARLIQKRRATTPDAKTAIVAPNNLDHDTSRSIAYLDELRHITLSAQVFTTIADAVAWLDCSNLPFEELYGERFAYSAP